MIEYLNKEEILRYLGYKDSGLTPRIESLLERCMGETLKIVSPKYVYERFPLRFCEDGVNVEGTTLIFKGKDIYEHLKNCHEVVLLGVTIGIGMDRAIKRAMVSEPDAGVVLDSCGIQAVEQLADIAEKEIEDLVGAEGYHLTWRYSPGYGDLPLETQRDMVQVLDLSRRIGVTLSESCLMIPSKSVTAILGIQDTKKDRRDNKCDFCNNKERCLFRKRGTRC